MVRFSELPDWTRVKLTDRGEKELWHRVDEFGGVKQLSEAFGYSPTKMYNWRSKHSFLPVEFVKQLMGNEATDEVKAFKGRGRSSSVENPGFPLEPGDELLTRLDESVVVNSDGTPVYQASEIALVKRFDQLLQELGEVPTTLYSRDLYELRFPKFLYELFESIEYEQDFAALVDENGKIEDGELCAKGRKVRVEEFSGRLYSREKRMELALERGDSEEVIRLMNQEAEKIRKLFGR
ncbi:MAG: hypothetical protein ABEJ69_02460 [Candidatus Nanohaloarchaea archaeon]